MVRFPFVTAIGVMVVLIGCGNPAVRIERGNHPAAEIRIEADGKEASVYLAPDVSVRDVIDLKLFDGFRAGMTLTEAENRHGKPARIDRSEWEASYAYRRNGSEVQVVEKRSLSSATNARVSTFVLRAPVEDPPFSDRLPDSLRSLCTSNERLRLLTLVSKVHADPMVRLEIAAGRVQAINIAPSPWWESD